MPWRHKALLPLIVLLLFVPARSAYAGGWGTFMAWLSGLSPGGPAVGGGFEGDIKTIKHKYTFFAGGAAMWGANNEELGKNAVIAPFYAGLDYHLPKGFELGGSAGAVVIWKVAEGPVPTFLTSVRFTMPLSDPSAAFGSKLRVEAVILPTGFSPGTFQNSKDTGSPVVTVSITVVIRILK